MKIFILTDELKTQIHTVDFQHQILIDKINAVTKSFSSPDNSQAILDQLNALARFTTQHFQYEQMIFTNFGYAQRKGHIKKHTQLLDAVQELVNQFEKTKTLNFEEVNNFLEQWLKNHIQVEDKSYVSFMSEHKVP